MDNKYDILNLLRGVAAGETTPEQALLQLKQSPFEDLGYAKVDFHRSIRQGAAEVIYGAGKTPEQIAKISAALMAGGGTPKSLVILSVYSKMSHLSTILIEKYCKYSIKEKTR